MQSCCCPSSMPGPYVLLLFSHQFLLRKLRPCCLLAKKLLEGSASMQLLVLLPMSTLCLQQSQREWAPNCVYSSDSELQ